MAEKSKKAEEKAAYTNRHNASATNLRREVRSQSGRAADGGQYAPPAGVLIRPRNMQSTAGPQTSGQGAPSPNPPQWGADPIPYQFAHPLVQAWAQNPNLAYFGGNGGIGGYIAPTPQPAPHPSMLAYYNNLQPWR